MSKTTYLLINPYIEGSFKTSYKSSSAHKAAKKFYEEFTDVVSNSLTNYGFSLYNTDTKMIHNFHLTEDHNPKNHKVKYNIEEVEKLESNKGTGKKLYQKYLDYKDSMKGGNYDDSSSSDSDSDSLDDDYVNMPIKKYYYSYLPYPTVNLYGLTPSDVLQLMKRYYTPSFIFEFSPTIVATFDLLI